MDMTEPKLEVLWQPERPGESIEEMLRMLVDDGVLARDNGAWVLRGDLSRAGAPETVHAVIAARLDRLDSAERSVLQRASIMPGRVEARRRRR
jgi:predicted ATPase